MEKFLCLGAQTLFGFAEPSWAGMGAGGAGGMLALPSPSLVVEADVARVWQSDQKP